MSIYTCIIIQTENIAGVADHDHDIDPSDSGDDHKVSCSGQKNKHSSGLCLTSFGPHFLSSFAGISMVQ